MNRTCTRWLSVAVCFVAFLAVTERAQAQKEFCGDGTCDEGENASSCPADCGCGAPGVCGDQAPNGCWCDCECVANNDCCPDADEACDVSTACGCAGSCQDQAASGCWCDCACVVNDDCCPDAEALCNLTTACTGACCFLTGCGDGTTQAACESQLGVYQGDGTFCSSMTCPPLGACCYEGDPIACIEVSQDNCVNIYSGEFKGEGTLCESDSVNPCPQSTGACCFQGAGGGFNVAGPVPVACGHLTSDACGTQGGQYQGDGTTCEPATCVVVGACCMDLPATTSCQVTTAVACKDTGGEYQGDFTHCYSDTCLPKGACCLDAANSVTANNVNCTEVTGVTCEKALSGEYHGDYTSCEDVNCNPERVDISKKGSLLFFSDVELEWTGSLIAGGGGFNLTKDTVISLINDYPDDVYVQMYFVNGDPELDPLFAGTPFPVLVREGEPGCNWVDCQLMLTPDQPVYWSAATGNPLGCQPFGILDPDLGNGPGRPNPDIVGGPRVLRGYVVAWAVNANGAEINWNHLSGKATIVDYAAQAAWEYGAWAFQAQFGVHGDSLPSGSSGPDLSLNGSEYDNAFDMLLFDFFAAGSAALSLGGNPVSVDTDLTLHPVSADLRQETNGPITTKAHFDIWNMNERKLSNTRRCLTCWDQSLLSLFNAPNTFLLANLQSDKGKARIDGKQADECEENCFRDELGNPLPIEDLIELLGDLFNDIEVRCSQDAALLGVAAKILRFGNNSIDYAGSELVGMGTQSALILYDVVDPPGSLRQEAFERIERPATKSQASDRVPLNGRGEPK